MIDLRNVLVFAVGWVGAFLILDSLLAMIIGKRYMLWGLEHTPSFYRDFIARLSGLPAKRLFAIKLAEGALGIAVLWMVQ